MKILIVFYSLTGHTKKIAQAIAAAVGGEVLEIKPRKELPRGFLKYFFGGRQVVKKELPEILSLDKNPADYELIFLGTPVWASTFVPAMRSFLAQSKLHGKKVALFCAHGGDNSGKAFYELEKELAGNEIVGKIDFKMDMISSAQLADNLEKVSGWARRIAGK